MRYIDTNVFVRFLTEEKDKISEEFLNFFHNLKEGKIKVKLLDLVFFQVIFVLKSFYKVKKEERGLYLKMIDYQKRQKRSSGK